MENILKLSDKTVLLTGPNTSVGRALALRLAELGANVALLDTNEKTARFADMIMDQREVSPSKGRAFYVHCNLTKPHHAQEAVRKAAETFGGVDIYIDAMMYNKRLLFPEDDIGESLDRAIDLNLRAPMLMTAEVVKFLKGRKNGRLIYLVQEMARFGAEGEALSSATRSGLISFSKSLARELGPIGVTANCVAMGPTEEYLLERHPEASSIREAQDRLLKSIPQAKWTDPNDVAEVITFLASPKSQTITGQVISASGGLTMYG